MQLYWYPRCSTCVKAKKFLERHGVAFNVIDITENPPSAAMLKKILDSQEYPLKKLFNTSGQMYRELNIKEKLPKMSATQALSLLSKNGKLIKRPVLTDGKRFVVGYDEKKIKELVS